MIKKFFSGLFSFIFVISCLCLTILLVSTSSGAKYALLNIMLSVVVAIILEIKFSIIKNIIFSYKKNLKITFLSIILTLSFIFIYDNYGGSNIKFFLNFFNNSYNFSIISLSVFFLSSLAAFCFIYLFLKWLIPKIKFFYNSLSLTEKRYLLIILILSSISTFVIFNFTKVFFAPTVDSIVKRYDTIYTTDSGAHYLEHTHLNINAPENDIRQPFFGLFSLPFAIISYMISKVFFFIPNLYFIILNVIQTMLIVISFVMLAKILKLKEKDELLFLLLLTFSFPTILFSFVLEQYAFCTFYLILVIYARLQNEVKINYYYIPAVGTLLVSGIVFPLISKIDSLKKWIKNVFECFVAFLIVTIISGRLPILLNAKNSINNLMRFAGTDITFQNKIYQYTHFFVNTLFAPKSYVNFSYAKYPAYLMSNYSGISILGLFIVVLTLIGFILNRKNKLAIISFLWIIYSFVILFIVGWGMAENGLILYSLYFSWAFIVLLFMLIKKVFENKSVIKYVTLFSIIIALLLINIPAFIDIIKFGMTYYPYK